MRKRMAAFVLTLLLLAAAGCEARLSTPTESGAEAKGDAYFYDKAESNADLLTTDSFVDITLSPAEGSGGIRTMTLHYLNHGEEQSDTLTDISLIDCDGYNDDNGREQTLTVSDYNHDGIVDFIVYREFRFPDLTLAHAEIPGWPTVYEYDMNGGFVIASSKYSEYFKTYAKTLNDQLDTGEYDTGDVAVLAVKRMIYAADRIEDGSFTPISPYENKYYEDVFELIKEIKE